ncbi:MAG: KH domain-containing protein [Dehalococcoidia bacterium]|nr:KH domain-containing protein [Dehalococcoidia bacterium]MDH5781806.1 KH domain-containing protein [Dehalococcoidia bacterium]
MEELEITAKTVEQATEEAEKRLGIGRDQFETVVVKEGKSGIFRGEGAVIRVKPLVPLEKDIVGVAIEVLENLLRLMEVTGAIKASSGEIPIALDIEGDDLGILIGRLGQTLACLQYIVRLIVAGRLKAWLPLSIDICGYKKRRRDSLQKLALRLAEQVKLRHRAMTLEPMPADERRIIHLALANHPDVVTHSVGEGEDRKVVILLKRG